jgi:hypothetical protein
MRGKWSPFRLPPRWRWMMWPLLGLSSGGTAAGVWLLEDPLAVAGEACLPLAALSSMYAIVYGFYHCIFKANSPCRKEADHHLSKRS